MTDSDWQCSVRGEWFPVPTLARDHEARHAALADLAADITCDTPPDRVIRTR